MIHPLVGNDEGTFNLSQMGNTVLRQHGDTIRSNQFRNTMVDFLVNMIWASGQNNTLHMIITQIFNSFLTFVLHILAGFGQFCPGSGDSGFDFLRTDICGFAEFLRHSLNNMLFIIQRKEWVHKPDMF